MIAPVAAPCLDSANPILKMRVAYIAPYQGKVLRNQRPIIDNLALAANLKIELIAELLASTGHQVEILSQGEVSGERSFTLYPACEEIPRFHPAIPVHYCSAIRVRRVQGVWSTYQMLRLLRARHREAPFDLVIIYNFKLPQTFGALHAIRRMGLPVVLEYEDDALVDVLGKPETGVRAELDRHLVRSVLKRISGCIAVSPHLLSQAPPDVPKLLLRGVIGHDIIVAAEDVTTPRENWVVFSGTHSRAKGLQPLLDAWRMAPPSGWQLHIAGHGELTNQLETKAAGDKTIVFHGLLNREQNARLLRQSKIGINPHELSHTPGNVFAFKIIEYLAAGTHVLTTPMGELEPELERGVTYISDNRAETIAASLARVIDERHFVRTAIEAAQRTYSPKALSTSLDRVLTDVVSQTRKRRSPY
jgi:glycosyltransferase involved in cell wall biosynthesis